MLTNYITIRGLLRSDVSFDTIKVPNHRVNDLRRQRVKRDKVTHVMDLLHMRNGDTKFMPMNGMPAYTAQPNAAAVAIEADTLPMSPSTGLLRTQSVIMHVTTEKTAIRANADEKYGTTVLVLFSSSMSSVRDPKRAVDMCLNSPESSALPTASRNASSHTEPLSTITTSQPPSVNNTNIRSPRERNWAMRSLPIFFFSF